MNLLVRCAVMMLVLVFSTPAFAQWMTQTITLRPGWNAVFLEVQPEPRECDAVFEGMPIESVWAWNKRFTSVQFIQDTSTLVPEQPEWLKYFPPDKPNAFATDLFTIQGGWAYLIHVGGTEPVQWRIKGKPLLRSIDWMSNSFNLVGFHVDAAAPPTFEGFFAPSPAHAGKPIYRINASGHWEVIPATEKIKAGEAYWVYCNGASDEGAGRFVIVTDEDLLSQFSGAVVRDGKAIGRRVSSAAFTSPEPIAMTGSVDDTLTCTITLGYDDPLNPFKHKYHPDHDNLDDDFDEQLLEGRESYTIGRTIALAFMTDDPEGRQLPGWGDNQIGCIYRESIQGVHKQELHVEGIFRLHHVSRVPVLNDGL